MQLRRVYRVACVLLMLDCTSKKTQDESFAAAADIHNRMVTRAQELERDIHALMQTPSPATDSLEAVLRDLQSWKDQLVEVPGHEHHEGDDAHGHEHHHAPPTQVTPDQMLLIQRDLDSTLNLLGERLTRIKKTYTR